jgi:hypothetical protein
MTDDDFRRLAWGTVANRIADLTVSLSAAVDLPMDEDDWLTVETALSDLDGVRGWFGTMLVHRLIATGWRTHQAKTP